MRYIAENIIQLMLKFMIIVKSILYLIEFVLKLINKSVLLHSLTFFTTKLYWPDGIHEKKKL